MKSKRVINVYDYNSPVLGELCAVSQTLKSDTGNFVAGTTLVCIVPKFNCKEYLSKLMFSKGTTWKKEEDFILSKANYSPRKTLMNSTKKCMYLETIVTNPNHTKKGLAKDLLEFCASLIDDNKYPSMHLQPLSGKGLKARINLFNKCGFKSPLHGSLNKPSYAVAPVTSLRNTDPNKFKPNKALSNLVLVI